MKLALAGDHDHLMDWLFAHGADSSPEALAKILREVGLKGRYKVWEPILLAWITF
jgi:hypothetical protein